MIRLFFISLILISINSKSFGQSCIEILQPSALSLNCTKIDLSSYNGTDGEAIANVVGGVSPYNFYWSTGATTNKISSLSEGTYNVTVTDSNGCSSICILQINNPSCNLPNAGLNETLTCVANNAPSFKQLGAANTGYSWHIISQPQGANATIDNNGYANHLTIIGEYIFEIFQNNYPQCKDEVKITIPNCIIPCPSPNCGSISVRKL